MNRVTGDYRISSTGGETVRAFVPHPLPPRKPPLEMDSKMTERLSAATAALGRLAVAGQMIPSADWFLYGFVR